MITRIKKAKTQDKPQNVDAASSANGQQKTEKNSSFDKLLRQILPSSSGNKISEEELFSAMVYERMHEIVGSSAANRYRSKLSELGNAGRSLPPEGALNEKTTLKALKNVAKKLGLSDTQANAVYSQAFDAANFDKIKDALYDGYAGKGDPTIALANTDSAIRRAKRVIEKMERAGGDQQTRSLASAKSTGNSVPAIGTVGDPLNIRA